MTDRRRVQVCVKRFYFNGKACMKIVKDNATKRTHYQLYLMKNMRRKWLTACRQPTAPKTHDRKTYGGERHTKLKCFLILPSVFQSSWTDRNRETNVLSKLWRTPSSPKEIQILRTGTEEHGLQMIERKLTIIYSNARPLPPPQQSICHICVPANHVVTH